MKVTKVWALLVVLGLVASAVFFRATHVAAAGEVAAALKGDLQSGSATPTPTPESSGQAAGGSAANADMPEAGATRISEVDSMEQVFIPAGEFLMGASKDDLGAKVTLEGGRAYPEIPQHTVYVDSFWIDKYEVTNGQYRLCVEAGVCTPPWQTNAYTYYGYLNDPAYDNYPVIWVTWYQARTYCEWAGRRLPTEAEWEKAARGTDGRMYPWGDEMDFDKRANFCDINCERGIANPRYDDGYSMTAPVGSFPDGASPYGVMDMAGNVWEWTASLIAPYPYDANDGREDLDVVGERAWRGGTWSNGYWYLRASTRYRSVMFYKWYNLGFRCASSQ